MDGLAVLIDGRLMVNQWLIMVDCCFWQGNDPPEVEHHHAQKRKPA